MEISTALYCVIFNEINILEIYLAVYCPILYFSKVIEIQEKCELAKFMLTNIMYATARTI